MSGSKVVSIARFAAVTVVAVVAVGVAVLTVVMPRMTNGVSLTVLTGSMQPSIPAGSVVLVKPVDPADVQVGDVITYQARPGVASFITHRVVEVDVQPDGRRTFTTKGDANRGEDPDPVPAGAVRGRVYFHAPHVGRIADTVRTPLGILGLVAIPGLVYVISQGREVLADLRGRRAHRHPSAEPPGSVTARELLLAAVPADAAGRRKVTTMAEAASGSLVTADDHRIVVTIAGTPEEIDRFEQLLGAWPDRQVRRSGPLTVDGPDRLPPVDSAELDEPVDLLAPALVIPELATSDHGHLVAATTGGRHDA